MRAASVKTPYGPSMETRVPGRSRPSRALPEPSSRTVMRADVPDGSAENEIGCACHHVPRLQNRHTAYWPPDTWSFARFRPLRWSEYTPAAIASTLVTRRR